MRFTIGVDVGGSSIKGALLLDGKIIKTASFSISGNKTFDESFAGLQNVIDQLYFQNVEKIGIVTTGVVDPKEGVVLFSVNIQGWSGARLKERVQKKYHVPTYVENDAIGALIAEASCYPDLKNITMLTFGTGVGGASLIDGKISRNPAHAWGARSIVPSGRMGKFGEAGSAEMYLSATALKKDASSFFHKRMRTKEIIQCFKRQDPIAVKVMEKYAKRLESFLLLIEKEIHPELIILGGGLMEATEAIRPLIKIPEEKYAFAHYGNKAGIVGASMLPFEVE